MVVEIGFFDPLLVYQRKQTLTLTQDPNNGSKKIAAKSLLFFQKQQKEEDLQVIDVFYQGLRAIREGKEPDTEAKKKFLQTADLYLKTMSKKYENKIVQGWDKCKSDPMMQAIEKLDRYVTAEKFPHLKTAQGLDASLVASLYTTQLAKQSLSSWVDLRHHTSMKNQREVLGSVRVPSHDEHVIPSKYAAESFLHFPEEVDFIKDLFLHRYISRFNETIGIDSLTKRHLLKHEGSIKPICDILPHLQYGTLYGYDYTKGIVAKNITEWTSLPVFRPRKHAQDADDYKLVIKTINHGHDCHAWVELKSPDAVFNIGYFPHHEDSLEDFVRFKTIRAEIYSPDLKELSGKEEHIVKTAMTISKDQFETLKQYIEQRQADAETKAYDQISNNCSSFVCDIALQIGVNIDAKENLLSLGLGWHVTFGLSQQNFIGKILRCIAAPLCYIRNFALYCRGAGNHNKEYIAHGISSRVLEFERFTDIFNVKKGFIDHPSRIREWQKLVAKKRNEKIVNFQETPAYSQMSEREKKQVLRRINLAIPSEITLSPADPIF